MHSILFKDIEHEVIDHINHNGWDNRRCNLRKCTRGQNGMNRRPNYNSEGKGVYFDKTHKHPWRVKAYIGSFDTKREALEAYNDFATRYYGEFAFGFNDMIKQ